MNRSELLRIGGTIQGGTRVRPRRRWSFPRWLQTALLALLFPIAIMLSAYFAALGAR